MVKRFLSHSKIRKREGREYCTICLLFHWFGLVCFPNKTKNVGCHTADSKPVKQEVNGTIKLPPLVFPNVLTFESDWDLECFPGEGSRIEKLPPLAPGRNINANVGLKYDSRQIKHKH